MDYNNIPRGHISTIILSTLLDGDKYGYEIIDTIEKISEGKLILKQPSLYSSLRRMEEQSLISSYWRDSDIGGKRHYYRLTDMGRKQTEEWQKELSEKQIAYEKTFSAINTNLAQNNTENTENVLEQANIFETTEDVKTEKEISKEEIEAPDVPINNQIDLFEQNKEITIGANPTQTEENVLNYTPENNDSKNDAVLLPKSANDSIKKDYNVKSELNRYIKERKSFADSYKDIDLEYKPNQTVVITDNSDLLEKSESQVTGTFFTEENNISNTQSTNENVVINKLNEKIDEGIFITESPNPEFLPKVKKIEPAIFENLNIESELAKKLFSHNNDSYPNLVNETPQQLDLQKPITEKLPSINEFSYEVDAEQLKNYFLTTRSGAITKLNTKNSFSKKYNINSFISCLFVFILVSLASVLTFLFTKDVIVNARFLFIVIPCIAFLPVFLTLITINRVKHEIHFNCKQFLRTEILAILLALINIAIHLLFNADFNVIYRYSLTLILIDISLILMPMYIMFSAILNKKTRF